MKIIFLEAVQNLGGARISTIELAERLQLAGHELLIVDFWGSCQPFVDLAKKKNLKIEFLEQRSTPLVLTSSNKAVTIANKLMYFQKMYLYKSKLKRIIQDFHPDLISVNNVKCLSLLQKSTTYKIQYIARGWFNYSSLTKLDKFYMRKHDLNFAAVSQATRQAIFCSGVGRLEKIDLLTDAVDVTLLSAYLNNSKYNYWHKSVDRPFVLLHCGGFLESKGQHVCIEIAKELRKLAIKFKFLLVGLIYKGGDSEKYFSQIKTKIAEEGLDDFFEIVLNETEVLQYFADADLLIHPSSTEGLPRVILESMAMGKPVIGNPVGGVIDVVIDNYTGYLTKYNVVDDYVNRIKDIFHNKNLYQKLSENCLYLMKESYDISLQNEKVERVYSAFSKI